MTCSITAELNGVTIDGSDPDADYVLLADSVSGMGLAETKPGDLDLGLAHGAVAGIDYLAPRVLRVPTAIRRYDDPEAAMQLLRALKVAWQPAGPDDQVLSVTTPGLGPTDDTLRFYGRPRGDLEVVLRNMSSGIVFANCRFEALDPLGYGPPETLTDSASPASVANLGDTPTDRFTITIVGNGGTPVITNTSDENHAVGFAAAFSGTAVLDFQTHTVAVGSVEDYSLLAPGPRWFKLVPGTNTITFTGCASVQLDWQPAYL